MPTAPTEALQALLSRMQDTDLRAQLLAMVAADAPQAEALLDELCHALYLDSPDLILVVDSQHRIVLANARARRMLARAHPTVTGSALGVLLEDESAADLLGLLDARYAGEAGGLVQVRDGPRCAVRLRPLLDGTLTLLVLRDSSRTHQLEAELQRARGLAGVGTLAADLAEAVVNPLGVIQGRLELLLAPEAPISPARLREQLEGLREHAHRIERAVLDLQAVASPGALARTRVPLGAVVRAAAAELGRRGERVQLEVQIQPPTLEVYADARQLHQLVGSLLAAAVAVTPTGRRVSLRAAPSGADTVELVFDDEGQGLSEAQLQALRSARSGQLPDPIVGLPLALSWLLVYHGGGQLEVHNRLQLGTRVRVRLPSAAPHRPRAALQAAEPASPLPPSLLVVDDDRMLCETVVWMLHEDGYDIQTAHSAEAALQILQQQRFDVILIDIRLPGMDGLELHALLARTQPALAARAVLTSALVHTPPDPAVLFLQKPFRREDLLARVAQIRRRQTPAAPEG